MATEMDVNHQDASDVKVGVEPYPGAPFENSAPIQQGPLYVNVEEKMPELASEDVVYEDTPELSVDRRDFNRPGHTASSCCCDSCWLYVQAC